MRTVEPSSAEKSPWRLILWTALAGLVFGLINFGQIAEDWLRIARNNAHKHPASGDIVVVKIDDKSLHEVGNWPWPRRTDAALIDRLTEAGARTINFDINFSFPSNPADDRAFEQSLMRSGRVALLARSEVGPGDAMERIDKAPLPQFRRYAKLNNATVYYNYQNAVWQLPIRKAFQKQELPSFAAALARAEGRRSGNFRIDYSIDVRTIPTYSATDVLNGRVGDAALAGKDVIVGIGTEIVGDTFFIPGYGRAFGVDVHALGGETLKAGTPVDFGWWPGFLIALGAAALAITRKRFGTTGFTLAAAAAAILLAPIALESRLIFFDVTPGLFVLLTVSAAVVRRRFKLRGLVNPVSGLPNLSALRAAPGARSQAIVAARILNFEEAVATLPLQEERKLVEQIGARLSLRSKERILYQGDGGIFAWLEDPRTPFANHLEALHGLFRNPARAAGLSIDLSVAFGVEVGSGRSVANRLASALVAADEAAHDGLRWKYHDPETLEDASWKLSILSQLDEAIDRGEVWVAFQPKLDLATREIIGAEALARWTHPVKGPIAASEFVAAAEQHNRIAKLTDFVLDRATAAAAQINKRRGDFDIAVNLSARLLSDKTFPLRLSALLARHGLAARHLTLELTETAALSGSGDGLEMIARLRELGVRIAIDDYGTGLSTLEYLKKIPASEIKIDQSFVRGMVENRSDRLMVQSTIGLAHSLGRKVVAEGVEQRETLEMLTELGCDVGQGFVIGRPMSIESLSRRLASANKRSAA